MDISVWDATTWWFQTCEASCLLIFTRRSWVSSLWFGSRDLKGRWFVDAVKPDYQWLFNLDLCLVLLIFFNWSRWWQLKHFLFSPLFGEDFQFDSYVSDELKPPTSDSIYGINPPLFNGRIFKWRPVSRHLNESNPSRIKSDLKGFESLQEDGFKRNHHIPRVFPVTLKKLVLGDHLRAENVISKLGWSKGHLEEAGTQNMLSNNDEK